LEELGIEPNFYTSLPYLTLSGATCWTDKGWLWIEDEEWCIFPPLPHLKNYISDPMDYPQKNIWSDFSNIQIDLPKMGFLDWEYIFDSLQFNHMEGHKWEVYRKNSRKWPARHPNWLYCDLYDYNSVGLLLSEWLLNKMDNVQDAQLIAEYLLSNHPSIHHRCLYDSEEQLMAVNVWDENWKFINYRYCIVKLNEPFLDEFSRWLFYTDKQIQGSGKMVNDGGTLGSAGLESFKDKLNPMKKREVYSWIIK
jgi:hypothetical protein